MSDDLLKLAELADLRTDGEWAKHIADTWMHDHGYPSKGLEHWVALGITKGRELEREESLRARSAV